MNVCEKDWIDILSALLTPTIAVFALGIAGFQLWLANTKLKHELFERRYVVYAAIEKYIGKTLSKGNGAEEMQREFLNKTNSAKFLFGSKYAEFVNKVWCETIYLETSRAIIQQPKDEKERQEHVQKRAEIKKSLSNMLSELNTISEPYLKLREIL